MAIALKLRVVPKFLASIFSGVGTSIRKDGLATYVDLDYSKLVAIQTIDPASYNLAIQSIADGSFAAISIAEFLSSAYTEQDIASGSTVTVQNSDGLIKINKTVGSPTTLTLPLSDVKIGPVKIVDWKGDAGTNNITINCSGTDKLNGNLSSWTIAADGGSIVLTPLKDGTGYAV